VTVIDAAARLADRTDVQFVLTGSGEEEAELRARAKALSNVVFTGWCDAEQISAIASVAWAGLAAYKRGTLVGLGNKVFEYMAYGLPLLICLPDEARRVVEKLGCGLFFEPESPESLEMAVRRLSDDSDLRNRMADSARRSFDAEFSAAAVYGRMASHLEMCMLRFRGKSGPHRW
jgi:glycosyltransferase involved in cell wall biosynthesis